MTEESVEPTVPDLRGRNRNEESLEDASFDSESVREEVDALCREAAFVPMVAKRRKERIRDAVGADD